MRPVLFAGVAMVAVAIVLAAATAVGVGSPLEIVPTVLVVGALVGTSVATRAERRHDVRRILRLQEQVHHLERLITDRSSELAAVSQLSHLGNPYRLWFGGWALGADSAAELVRQLQARGVTHALEAGSGVSTLIMGRHFRDAGAGLVVSLESNPAFAATTREHARAMGLSEYVLVVDSRLVDVQVGHETFAWYSLGDDVADRGPYDLLLVDGPHQKHDDPALVRYPALPLLSRLLAPDAVVMVDDAKRPAEVRMLERWKREFPEWRAREVTAVKGLQLLERFPPATDAPARGAEPR